MTSIKCSINAFVVFVLVALGAYSNESIFTLTPELSYYSYREPSVMKITGPGLGLDCCYQYIDKNKVTFLIHARANFINGTYDGRTQTGDKLINNNDNSCILETAPKLGYVLTWQESNINITPYTGVGYRYLNNDTSVKNGGYLRVY
ncbi:MULTISPECIES: hypothetical protein [Cysteiniphilum]|uniref:hypothetical protein n=1 Tax=Cysteiniphilum TaxID=2056696 RepID=UPI00177EB684|nr:MULTISPECIES: hypothetical protein [Cysteiniphilum]